MNIFLWEAWDGNGYEHAGLWIEWSGHYVVLLCKAFTQCLSPPRKIKGADEFLR